MKKFRKQEDAQEIADVNKSYDDEWSYIVVVDKVTNVFFVIQVYDEDGEYVNTL